MKTTQYLVTSVVSSLLLSACFGGSSGGKVDIKPDPNPSKPEYLYSAKAKLKNECGVESANQNAYMIVHNDDFSTLTTIDADVNGDMSYKSDKALESITIVSTHLEMETGEPALKMTTYLGVAPGNFDTQFNYTGGKDGCNCNTSTITATLPDDMAFTYPDRVEVTGFTSYGEIDRDNSQYLTIENAELCLAPGEAGKPIEVAIEYRPAFIDEWDEYVAYSSSYQLGDELQIVNKAESLNVDISIPSSTEINDSFNYAFTVKDGKWIGPTFNYDVDSFTETEFKLFEFEQTDFYLLSLGTNLWQEDEIRVIAYHDAYFNQRPQTAELSTDFIDENMALSIANQDTGSYDYSNLTMFDFMTSHLTDNSSNFDWYIVMPLKGKVPNFEALELKDQSVLATMFTDVNSLSYRLSLKGYEQNVDSYEDVISTFYRDDRVNDFSQFKNAYSLSIRMTMDLTNGFGSGFGEKTQNSQSKMAGRPGASEADVIGQNDKRAELLNQGPIVR